MTKSNSTDLVKLYYRIGEVSEIVGVQPHVLRYWETEFRTIRPQKSTKGQRIYSRRDVEKLLRVKDLLKNQGFTIAGARRRLRDPASSSAATAEGLHVDGGETTAVYTVPRPAEVPRLVVTDSTDNPLAASRQLSPAVEVSGVGEPGATAGSSGKSLRRALLSLRRDLLRMQHELQQDLPK